MKKSILFIIVLLLFIGSAFAYNGDYYEEDDDFTIGELSCKREYEILRFDKEDQIIKLKDLVDVENKELHYDDSCYRGNYYCVDLIKGGVTYEMSYDEDLDRLYMNNVEKRCVTDDEYIREDRTFTLGMGFCERDYYFKSVENGQIVIRYDTATSGPQIFDYVNTHGEENIIEIQLPDHEGKHIMAYIPFDNVLYIVEEEDDCEITSCIDTDDGKDYTVRGYSDIGSKKVIDHCQSPKKLVESYCKSDSEIAVLEEYCDCEDGRCLPDDECTKSHICPDGTKIQQCELASNGGCACIEVECADSCTDTDLGKQYESEGYASKDDEVLFDECFDESTLVEAYCDNNNLRTIKHDCVYGCSNGECNKKVEGYYEEKEQFSLGADSCKRIFKILKIDEKDETISFQHEGETFERPFNRLTFSFDNNFYKLSYNERTNLVHIDEDSSVCKKDGFYDLKEEFEAGCHKFKILKIDEDQRKIYLQDLSKDESIELFYDKTDRTDKGFLAVLWYEDIEYILRYNEKTNYLFVEEKPCSDCYNDSDCADENACTLDKCENGKCSYLESSGCSIESSCAPIGTRTENKYCDIGNEIKDQKLAGDDCFNNFECETNLCLEGECTEYGFIEKILLWLKKFF
jgi:hypothetical protein